MNLVTGIITRYCSDGSARYKLIEKQPIKLMSLALRKDKVWDIGIDQSSSCTGQCFQSADKEFQILLDLHRDQNLSNSIFYAEMTRLMEKTVSGMNIRMLVSEKPAPTAMYASRVLEELKGHIDAWGYTIPEFEYTLKDSLFQQTWKSYIVDKSKGKGRWKVKSEVAADVVDMFPALAPYYNNYPWSDYDSFDATGILNGFLCYAFDKDGNEKIHGVKEKRHTSLVGYVWCDCNDAGILQRTFHGETALASLDPKFLIYNENATLHDNVRMASSNYDFIVTVLPRDTLSQFEWKYDIESDDESKMMLMMVMRTSRFTNGTVNFFKSCVPWNEEVYDE